MPRFTKMLHQAFLRRGYEVEVWAPKAIIHRWFNRGFFGKWAGYIDQYIFFPLWVKKAIRLEPDDTIFVFCDQALGPWVPIVQHLPHVIHCHDFLALRSALGEFPQHPVRLTGRIYQSYIRHGYQSGKFFISVSQNSKNELSRFLNFPPVISEAVHNGLNFEFEPMSEEDAQRELSNIPAVILDKKMLVHVGGNTWYKNRIGVMRIYAEYCKKVDDPLPLWMVGDSPSSRLRELAKTVAPKGKVYFLSGLSNRQVQAIYSQAKALVFPSIAEGFGWPIAEAMACGCPVLTTGEAPMTEVGGGCATYIPVMPHEIGVQYWAENAAITLIDLLSLTEEQKEMRKVAALEHVRMFSAERAISAYEEIYHRVMTSFRQTDK